ncbi:unnamed protein product, partial [Ranitomeya imitator]
MKQNNMTNYSLVPSGYMDQEKSPFFRKGYVHISVMRRCVVDARQRIASCAPIFIIVGTHALRCRAFF